MTVFVLVLLVAAGIYVCGDYLNVDMSIWSEAGHSSVVVQMVMISLHDAALVIFFHVPAEKTPPDSQKNVEYRYGDGSQRHNQCRRGGRLGGRVHACVSKKDAEKHTPRVSQKYFRRRKIVTQKAETTRTETEKNNDTTDRSAGQNHPGGKQKG